MDEWEPIPISRLSHAAYCLRRAALITNDRLWMESVDTVKGHLEHRRVHTSRIEKRGQEISLFEYDVFSRKLNVAGKCDQVDAIAEPSGCIIPAAGFPVKLYPVEYKHGKVREEEEYEIQLCAQAMCLEEMFQTSIAEGAVFYISSHRRKPVLLDDALRKRTLEVIEAIDHIRKTFCLPPAEYGNKCFRCSMKEVCLPEISRSAQAYCRQLENEAKKVDLP